MPRIGGRAKGTPNRPFIDKLRANIDRFERELYKKAEAGDVAAIAECRRILKEVDEEEKKKRRSSSSAPPTPRTT